MPPQETRRRRIRLDKSVYSQPGTVALLTTCTSGRRPLFSIQKHAGLVTEELRRLHGDMWRVLGYCVMPDHVHLLVLNLRGSLMDFMRLLKGRTAQGLRKSVSGAVWQRSFHDHLIRRTEDIAETLRYLLENPVRAGLVSEWVRYPWCGSLQWPKIGPEFFALNPTNVLWAELLTTDEDRGRG